jgi:hypothetical protein
MTLCKHSQSATHSTLRPTTRDEPPACAGHPLSAPHPPQSDAPPPARPHLSSTMCSSAVCLIANSSTCTGAVAPMRCARETTCTQPAHRVRQTLLHSNEPTAFRNTLECNKQGGMCRSASDGCQADTTLHTARSITSTPNSRTRPTVGCACKGSTMLLSLAAAAAVVGVGAPPPTRAGVVVSHLLLQ